MNPLRAEATAAALLALRIYDPAVGRLVCNELGWRAQVSWAGDLRGLEALIDGVRRDAVRLPAPGSAPVAREVDSVTAAREVDPAAVSEEVAPRPTR